MLGRVARPRRLGPLRFGQTGNDRKGWGLPVLRRLLLIAAAAVTIGVTTHAGLLWLALWTVTVCAVQIKPISKTQGTEVRVNRFVTQQGNVNQAQAAATGAVNGRVNNLSGQATGTGLPAGVPTGGPSINSTSTNGLSSPGITGTSGGASAGTAHTHSAGSYVVGSGQHSHDLQNHAHDFDGHTHDLPSV